MECSRKMSFTLWPAALNKDRITCRKRVCIIMIGF
jgi:hypothetical protein